MRTTGALCLIAASVCAAQIGPGNPLRDNATAAENGRVTFRIMCSPCHGISGEGGRGPDLTLGVYSVGSTDADLFRVIANGVSGTEMPDFSSQMEETDIWQLVSYVRLIAGRKPSPIAGDRDAGKSLFWGKGQCGRCHVVDGKGGRFGPDLTRCGRQRSAAYLKASILDPNADLTPGYYAITVVTRDNKKIVGMQKGFDNFSAQLMDVSEAYYSFQKRDVISINREFRSLMPNTYRSLFSAGELNDILAYLVSLRAEAEEQR